MRDLKRRQGLDRQEIPNNLKSHPELFGIVESRRPTGGYAIGIGVFEIESRRKYDCGTSLITASRAILLQLVADGRRHCL
jgi:hypothetical protein